MSEDQPLREGPEPSVQEQLAAIERDIERLSERLHRIEKERQLEREHEVKKAEYEYERWKILGPAVLIGLVAIVLSLCLGQCTAERAIERWESFQKAGQQK